MRSNRVKIEGPTSRAPDQRSARKGAAQVTKPATVIDRLIQDDPNAALRNALQLIPIRRASARCMNPDCSKKCTWRTADRGRAPRFCSDNCRLSFSRKRAALLEELRAYTKLRDLGQSDRRDRAQLERRISGLRMLLDRYPSLD